MRVFEAPIAVNSILKGQRVIVTVSIVSIFRNTFAFCERKQLLSIAFFFLFFRKNEIKNDSNNCRDHNRGGGKNKSHPFRELGQ